MLSNGNVARKPLVHGGNVKEESDFAFCFCATLACPLYHRTSRNARHDARFSFTVLPL